MKKSRLIYLTLLALSQALPADEQVSQEPLSKSQADDVIREEMNLASQKAARRLREIRAVPATEVSIVSQGRKKVVMRRVAPRPWVGVKPPPTIAPGDGNMGEWLSGLPRTETLHLSATVFDRSCTELVWRKDDKTFTILSNIDFNYMTTVGGFDDRGVDWSVLFFVDNIDPAKELIRARRAAEYGIIYIPRGMPDTTILSADHADYVIYAESAADVPEDLVEELEAVHRYYAANEGNLKIAWQRRQALAEARRAWQAAHPPKAGNTVINFRPVRSNFHSTK